MKRPIFNFSKDISILWVQCGIESYGDKGLERGLKCIPFENISKSIPLSELPQVGGIFPKTLLDLAITNLILAELYALRMQDILPLSYITLCFNTANHYCLPDNLGNIFDRNIRP